MSSDDPFDTLFTLEDTYHAEGHAAGLSAGRHQSRLEARLFGLEKGFEKFAVLGGLQAKARLWTQRLEGANAGDERVRRHVEILTALVDARSLSMLNTDEAVAEFDERIRRAQAKVKVVERLFGEVIGVAQGVVGGTKRGDENMEDFGAR